MNGIRKYKLNFIIDVLMYFLMLALAGIGFLLAYVLVSGREVAAKYGPGVDPYLFGLDRNAWGDIHLVLAFIMLGLLVAHIALHWKVILGMFGSLVKTVLYRKIVAGSFTAVSLFLLFFFVLFETELQPFQRGTGRGRLSANLEIHEPLYVQEKEIQSKDSTDAGSEDTVGLEPDSTDYAAPHRPHSGENKQFETVRGMYTLGAVAEKHGVPVTYILKRLGLPQSISSNEKLGQLRKRYGFRMSDLEKIIIDYKAGLK